ncbi:NUDIX hydrolase [Hyphobacterium sp. CCMP332]|nr:NUDIX hydrolase [Hyphobacterium sp. CCMP332]
MKENPWKTLSEENVYDNPWIQVSHNRVINPNGGEGIYGKVSFKNLAIGIIPIDNELNTWLVGQYRYTIDEYSWEIPMGGGKIGIPAIESAKRELKEETGIIAKNWDLISKIHTSNSVTDELGFTYLAQDLSFEDTEFEETERLEIKKLPLLEAFELVMKNEITDSLSQAGILKAHIFADYDKNQIRIPESNTIKI